MSKLNYNRPNRDLYVKKFCERTGSSDWPPKDGAESAVKERVIDLLLHEAMNVIKPQLEELKLTLPSHQIMTLVWNNVKTDVDRTPLEHYDNVSNAIFTLIEQEVPGLLGQDDPSDWSFVVEV